MKFQHFLKKININRLFRYMKHRLCRHKATTEDLAASFSLGVFIGMMPTFGFALILSILAAVFLKLPKAMCFLGTFIANPWTTPLFYTISWKLGNYFFQLDINEVFVGFTIRDVLPLHIFLIQLLQLYKPLILGGLIISIPTSVVIYYIVLLTIRKYKKIRKSKF
ncbi:MAG: DUF2062 domain-containing protein [Candidatus Muiribacteriota bacterium]